MSEGIVLFVEGETEEEFYSCLIDYLRGLCPNCKSKLEEIIIINASGIGNYKSKVCRKFENEILIKYSHISSFTVFLCYDTDVFEYATKPPINRKEVEKQLKDLKAAQVFHLNAKEIN